MLGFAIGTLCLLGLIKVLRGGRDGCGRERSGRGGWGGWRGGRGGGWGGGGFAPRRMLRWVFERLDTSPGQEKVLADAAREMADVAAPLREEAAASRRDLARALRGAAVDEEALGELFARQDEVLREARKRAVGALARVHDALDERQRETLAGILESPWRRPRGERHGPYREPSF